MSSMMAGVRLQRFVRKMLQRTPHDNFTIERSWSVSTGNHKIRNRADGMHYLVWRRTEEYRRMRAKDSVAATVNGYVFFGPFSETSVAMIKEELRRAGNAKQRKD